MLPRTWQPLRRLVNTAATSTVQITTLPNRIRVATESTPGHFTSVGLYVDAGSRYETASNSGVSHFIDRLAFKSSSNLDTGKMASMIDSIGGQIMCASSREAIMYQASYFGSATPTALSLIAETVLEPTFDSDELDSVRDSTLYEVRELQNKPELILPEVLHHVAYGGTGLGNPLVCPEDRIDAINGVAIRSFMGRFFRPERMVVAGAGIPHEDLVKLTLDLFSSLPDYTSTPTQPLHQYSIQPQHLMPPNSKTPKNLSRAASSLNQSHPSHQSTYRGGHLFNNVPDSPLTHIYIAFEGLPINDPDIYTLATLQFVLGGGGSFSAGGPGKGMYSRLYTHVLNHHPEIDHCASFHHIYTDSSLFGLFASFFPPENGLQVRGASPNQILPHLVHQFSLLLHTPVPGVELDRAKNQLKSSLVMALESRAVEVEDLGRQILVHGQKISVGEMCDRIDEVSVEDVQRVSHRIFGESCSKPPSIVVQGPENVTDHSTMLRKYGVSGLAV